MFPSSRCPDKTWRRIPERLFLGGRNLQRFYDYFGTGIFRQRLTCLLGRFSGRTDEIPDWVIPVFSYVLLAVKKWKTWLFGKQARGWTVRPDAAAWARSHGGIPRENEKILRRQPSATVPESLEKILRNPSSYIVKQRRDWDYAKYARLNTGETYSVGPSFEFTLRNAWLHVPSGFVITEDREILGFSSCSLPSLYAGHAQADLDEAPWVEEAAFKLSTVYGSNYAHWLMDALPSADYLAPGDNRMVVLDKPSPPFQRRSLQLLGLPDVLEPAVELLRFRELHFVSPARSGVPDPRPLLRVKSRLLAAVGANNGPRRIYISRQRTRRKIVNSSEVSRVLGDFGFEEVFTEEMDFAAQLRLFAGAEAVFGAHGAGTMNVLFAPEGAALIEAFNPRVWDHAAHRVASLCRIRHYHLFGSNVSRDYDIRIDPFLLERVLALALDNSERPRQVLAEQIF